MTIEIKLGTPSNCAGCGKPLRIGSRIICYNGCEYDSQECLNKHYPEKIKSEPFPVYVMTKDGRREL